MKYYCYVYYDENWQAYYVGKGVGRRMYTPHGHPELPSKERIQRFDFEQEWQAWECEIELIAFWGRQCDGGCLLNKSIGGPGVSGVKRSDETRAKISAAHAGKSNHFYGKKHTAETKAKMSAAQAGNQNWKGKKHSAETKAKMSKVKIGRKLSAEHRAKLSAAKKEYWRKIRKEQA